MIFNNVADVFDSVEQLRLQLYERVEGLTEEQARFRPSPDAWSVAEITEHLSIFEALLLNVISGLVAKGEASQALLDQDATIAPVSIENIAAQVNGKAQAPEFLQPTGQIPLERSIENLRQTREALMELKPRLLARDFTPVTLTREPLGPLNPYQWVAFIGFHEDRHLGQVAALISSESFPPRQAASA